jgi:arylsulfatase A
MVHGLQEYKFCKKLKMNKVIWFLLLLPFKVLSQNETNPPNVILILVDDLGIKDLGNYGNKLIETPNIDALAKKGMSWINAYSSCPVCSPSRAAMLTGKSPARLNFTGHITAIEKHRYPANSTIIPPQDLMYVPLDQIMIPEMLKVKGYTSASIGKWHLGNKGFWPTDQGFDVNIAGWTHGSPPSHFFPYKNTSSSWNSSIQNLVGGREGEYLTDRLTDETISFIRQQKDKPFFAYLSYYAVHVPLEAPQEKIEKYKVKLLDSKINPTYAAMVESVDDNVGKLVKFLESNNLIKNTVIILASDNGGLEEVTDNYPYRRGKGHLYEAGIRVPLIMRWDDKIKPNTWTENRTISTDLFYTIKDISGQKGMIDMDGRSLLPDFDLKNQSNKERKLFWYYPHYGIGGDPGSIIISGNYKLIEHYDPYKVELFNLDTDRSENHDLASSFPQIKNELLEELHNWLKSSNPIMHTQNTSNKSVK